MTNVEIVMKRTGTTDKELAEMLVQDATEQVLSETNRTKLIPALEKPVRDLAVIAYNRMGTEGESSRSEGGETYNFDTELKDINRIIKRYRLARVGGAVFEAKEKQAETVLP